MGTCCVCIQPRGPSTLNTDFLVVTDFPLRSRDGHTAQAQTLENGSVCYIN